MHKAGTRYSTLTSLLQMFLDLPYFSLTESETEGSVDTSMWIHDVSSVCDGLGRIGQDRGGAWGDVEGTK